MSPLILFYCIVARFWLYLIPKQKQPYRCLVWCQQYWAKINKSEVSELDFLCIDAFSMQPECLNRHNHVEEMFLFCSHWFSCYPVHCGPGGAGTQSRERSSLRSTSPLSPLSFFHVHQASPLFPSNIFNLSCSGFQFHSDTSYSFSLVEKSGEFACFGRSWPKAPSHSELVFSLLIHQHWLSWVLTGVEQTAIINENLHWHIFSRRRGFCSLGYFDAVITYSWWILSIMPKYDQCLVLVVVAAVLYSAVYCEMQIQNSSYLLTMQCVCVFRSHIVKFSFSLQQISLLFVLCCWLCPQVNPTIHIFPHF